MSLQLPVPAFDFANDAYTEEQMQAYGQECRAAALEEAAQVCESQNQGWHSDDAALIAHQIRSLKP